jgi:hypothetical protein
VEKWVTREIREECPHIAIRAVIEFWELLASPQRTDLLLKFGLVRRLYRQMLH